MVELSYSELEDYINEISLGKKFVELNNKFYILSHPSKEGFFESRLIYSRTYDEARDFGLPTMKELEKVLYNRGIYTDEDEEKIREIEKKIEGQKAVLEKTVRVPARRDRLIHIIDGHKKEISDIRRKKLVMMERTCEAKAKEEQYLFLCRKNTYAYKDEEETLLWKSLEDFNKEDSFVRRFLISKYVELLQGVDVGILRAIARSNLFAIRYVNSTKTSTPIFGRSADDYTIDMTSLCYWAQWYRSLYEMMPEDIPPEHIIDDDRALDAYMEDVYARRKNEREMNRATRKMSGTRGRKSPYDFDDVIITKSNPIYQDVEYNHQKKFSKKQLKGDEARERRGKAQKVIDRA